MELGRHMGNGFLGSHSYRLYQACLSRVFVGSKMSTTTGVFVGHFCPSLPLPLGFPACSYFKVTGRNLRVILFSGLNLGAVEKT